MLCTQKTWLVVLWPLSSSDVDKLSTPKKTDATFLASLMKTFRVRKRGNIMKKIFKKTMKSMISPSHAKCFAL